MTAIPNSAAPVKTPVTNQAVSILKGIAKSPASGARTNAPSASFLQVIAQLNQAVQAAGIPASLPAVVTAGAGNGKNVKPKIVAPAALAPPSGDTGASTAKPAAATPPTAASTPPAAASTPPLPPPPQIVPQAAPVIAEKQDKGQGNSPDPDKEKDSQQQQASSSPNPVDSAAPPAALAPESSSPQLVIPVMVPPVPVQVLAAMPLKLQTGRALPVESSATPVPAKSASTAVKPQPVFTSAAEEDPEPAENAATPLAAPLPRDMKAAVPVFNDENARENRPAASPASSNPSAPSVSDKPAATGTANSAPSPALNSNANASSSAGPSSTQNFALPLMAPPVAPAPQSSALPPLSQITTAISDNVAAKPQMSAVSGSSEPAPLVVSAQDGPSPAILENARLVQSPGRTEMHIGISSESFGTVDVHAVMRNDVGGVSSVGASITVQSHEAQALLAKELPALQGHLEQRNVHVGEITVIPESLSAGSGMQQQQGGSPQESYGRQPRTAYTNADSPGSAKEESAEPAAQTWAAGNGHLSVMA
jgi:flagellar hook-length control protein FliK